MVYLCYLLQDAFINVTNRQGIHYLKCGSSWRRLEGKLKHSLSIGYGEFGLCGYHLQVVYGDTECFLKIRCRLEEIQYLIELGEG
jgi:hypothetical protein